MHLVPNVWATLVAGAIFWVLGAIWYAGLFGKMYQSALKLSAEEMEKAKKNFPKALVVHFLCGIVAAYVIGRIVKAAGCTGFGQGIWIGLWVWLGFTVTLFLVATMFERYLMKMFWINNGFYIIAYAIMGGVMSAWQ